MVSGIPQNVSVAELHTHTVQKPKFKLLNVFIWMQLLCAGVVVVVFVVFVFLRLTQNIPLNYSVLLVQFQHVWQL